MVVKANIKTDKRHALNYHKREAIEITTICSKQYKSNRQSAKLLKSSFLLVFLLILHLLVVSIMLVGCSGKFDIKGTWQESIYDGYNFHEGKVLVFDGQYCNMISSQDLYILEQAYGDCYKLTINDSYGGTQVYYFKAINSQDTYLYLYGSLSDAQATGGLRDSLVMGLEKKS
jgi:hypothetical protein